MAHTSDVHRRTLDVRLWSILFLALPLLFTACATERAPGRAADWTDALSVRLSVFTLGAHAQVGPAQAGLVLYSGADGDAILADYGPGGLTTRAADGISAAAVVPITFAEVARVHRAGKGVWRKPSGWRKRDPTFGSIGFDVGFLLGVGVHLDVVELADALLGYAGIDFLHDDPPPAETEAPPDETDPG